MPIILDQLCRIYRNYRSLPVTPPCVKKHHESQASLAIGYLKGKWFSIEKKNWKGADRTWHTVARGTWSFRWARGVPRVIILQSLSFSRGFNIDAQSFVVFQCLRWNLRGNVFKWKPPKCLCDNIIPTLFGQNIWASIAPWRLLTLILLTLRDAWPSLKASRRDSKQW